MEKIKNNAKRKPFIDFLKENDIYKYVKDSNSKVDRKSKKGPQLRKQNEQILLRPPGKWGKGNNEDYKQFQKNWEKTAQKLIDYIHENQIFPRSNSKLNQWYKLPK